jgi:hypothetical protein
MPTQCQLLPAAEGKDCGTAAVPVHTTSTAAHIRQPTTSQVCPVRTCDICQGQQRWRQQPAWQQCWWLKATWPGSVKVWVAHIRLRGRSPVGFRWVMGTTAVTCAIVCNPAQTLAPGDDAQFCVGGPVLSACRAPACLQNRTSFVSPTVTQC